MEEKKMIRKTLPDTKTGSEIMRMECIPPDNIVVGVLHVGVTILAAKPKAGKTIFGCNLAISVAGGKKFLNSFDVTKTKVLFIALEDTYGRIQSRLSKMRYAPNNSILFAYEWPTIPDGGIQMLDKWLNDDASDNYRTRLIIIDTLARFRGFKKSSGIYKNDYEIIANLKSLADKYSIGILVLNHLRKDEPRDIFDMISGSVGITAGADTTIVMTRDRGSEFATLILAGREIGDAKYSLSFDETTLNWRLLGNSNEFNLGTARKQIVNYLKKRQASVPLKEIAADLGKNKPVLYKLLTALRKEGLVMHKEGGLYQYIKQD